MHLPIAHCQSDSDANGKWDGDRNSNANSDSDGDRHGHSYGELHAQAQSYAETWTDPAAPPHTSTSPVAKQLRYSPNITNRHFEFQNAASVTVCTTFARNHWTLYTNCLPLVRMGL